MAALAMRLRTHGKVAWLLLVASDIAGGEDSDATGSRALSSDYDCQAVRPTWSSEQREWCCLMKKVGCPASLNAVPSVVSVEWPSTGIDGQAPHSVASTGDTTTAAESVTATKVATTTPVPVTMTTVATTTVTTTASAETKLVSTSKKVNSTIPAAPSTPAAAVMPEPGLSDEAADVEAAADALASYVVPSSSSSTSSTPSTPSTPSTSSAPSTMPGSSESGSRQSPQPEVAISKPLADNDHDCLDDLWHWKTAWSAEKKEWCCAHEMLSCPEGAVLFDCTKGSASDWSPAQRQWCCRHLQVGCSAECQSSCHSDDGVSATCVDRIKWGISHQFAGQATACPKAHALVSEQCQEACLRCEAESVCNEESLVADCQVGSFSAWSASKRRRCCQEDGVNCPSSTRLYDCSHDSEERKQWGSEKKAWCCKTHRKGCPEDVGSHLVAAQNTPETPRLEHTIYDCIQGYKAWQIEWNEAKRAWCCEKHDRGCTGAGSGSGGVEEHGSVEEQRSGQPLDCGASRPELLPPVQRNWCCASLGLHCEAVDYSGGLGIQQHYVQWSTVAEVVSLRRMLSPVGGIVCFLVMLCGMIRFTSRSELFQEVLSGTMGWAAPSQHVNYQAFCIEDCLPQTRHEEWEAMYEDGEETVHLL